MDISEIKYQLKLRRDREWPDEWGAKENEMIGDYFGWCHRYRLNDPVPEDEIGQFEDIYRIQLPKDYRQFLAEIGNGGAGPYYGVESLAEFDGQQLDLEILMNLKQEFSLSRPWNGDSKTPSPDHEEFDPENGYYSIDLMKGAMPIASQGSTLDFWMVVTGRKPGEIWIDKRTDGEGVEPVLSNSGKSAIFGEWYMEWLNALSA